MIKKSLAMVVAVLVSAAVGCGAEDMGGLGMLGTDAGAATDTLPGTGGATGAAGGTAGMASDAGAGLGGATGSAAGTGGSAQGGTGGTGTGGAQATGGVTGSGGTVGAGGAGGTAADVPYCSSATHAPVSGCGFLVTVGQWEYLWKDGMACGTCTLDSKPVVGCKIPPPPNTTSNPVPLPEFILCVSDCRAQCCYKRVGATCTSDANCCSPMHCMDNGAGKSKSCR